MEMNSDFVTRYVEYSCRLALNMIAAVAEAEAKAISERTKIAHTAAKTRGAALGSI